MKTLAALLGPGLLACACEQRAVERPSPAALDKQAVFGSASLVPTREGERARRELAIAGELEQALARLGLGPAMVDVELRGAGGETHEASAVIVIARRPHHLDAGQAEATVAELVGAMVPGLEAGGLHLWWQPTIAEAPGPAHAPTWRSWALMFSCLGLGLSLGVLAERMRSRW
ncbi:MAG: hypothetical protein R6X02_25705 [Enhygromyxa sp.]